MYLVFRELTDLRDYSCGRQSITIIPSRNRLRIYVDGPDKYYRLRELKRALPDVVVKVQSIVTRLDLQWFLLHSVQGVSTIRRAIINIKEENDHRGKKGDKELLVEGYGLQKVMTTQGKASLSSWDLLY